jgi:hypothetical protein
MSNDYKSLSLSNNARDNANNVILSQVQVFYDSIIEMVESVSDEGKFKCSVKILKAKRFRYKNQNGEYSSQFSFNEGHWKILKKKLKSNGFRVHRKILEKYTASRCIAVGVEVEVDWSERNNKDCIII